MSKLRRPFKKITVTNSEYVISKVRNLRNKWINDLNIILCLFSSVSVESRFNLIGSVGINFKILRHENEIVFNINTEAMSCEVNNRWKKLGGPK